jgi:hypothetical protein
MKPILGTVPAAVLVLLFCGPHTATASFDIRPLSPAERGAANGLALGLAEETSGDRDADESGGPRLRTLQVYGFRPFGLDEVDFVAASADFALRRSVALAMSYHMLSALSYRERALVLSCRLESGMLEFEPAVRAGAVTLDQSVIDWTVLFDLALHARPLSGVKVFFGASNPFALGLVRSGARCPTDIRAGLGYKVHTGLAFGVEIWKEGGFPTSVATGVELFLADPVRLRTGMRTHPKEFSVGLGLRWGRLVLDTSSSFHLDLGVTHEAGLTYLHD